MSIGGILFIVLLVVVFIGLIVALGLSLSAGTGTTTSTISPSVKYQDTMPFISWHVWLDEGTFNFVNNADGQTLRLWGAEKKVTSEKWSPTKAPTDAQDTLAMRSWNWSMNAASLTIESKATGARFTITSQGSSIATTSIAPTVAQSIIESAPTTIDFGSGAWKLDTDDNEFRIVHLKSGNTFRINKQGAGFS